MREKHVKERLSAYLDQELPKEERQAIAEHLLQCENCRNEHDAIKFGAALASRLQRADAPPSVWNEIENALDDRKTNRIFPFPHFSFFNRRGLIAAVFLIGFGLMATIYVGLLRNNSPETAKNASPVQNPNVELSQSAPMPDAIPANRNENARVFSDINSSVQTLPAKVKSNNQISPVLNSTEPSKKPSNKIAEPKNLPEWNVETLAGMPKAGSRAIAENGKLAVGQFLETDADSRARVQVANIGQVEIAPNSRVQLIKTGSTEHRLSLERGVLNAKILAPPRLFIVDTPAAAAVDLGCEYTLEVDKNGDSKLHVTSGFVALERDGRESIVPAGAVCLTKKGKGLGTPFSADASTEFQAAIFKFDFADGGSESVNAIIEKSNVYDAITLWHLLSRTQSADREKVFDALASFVKLPAGATRTGVLSLNKKMLDEWWKEIEAVWFG